MQPTNSFQTLKRGIIPIEDVNTGRKWEIRDDTPMDIIVQYLDIQQQLRKFGELKEAFEQDPGKAKMMLLEADRMTAEYLLSIFQFTYPETTLEEIRKHFAFEDRQDLAQHFFILRSNRSSTLLSKTAAQAEANAALNPPTTANRKTRRASR